MNTAQIASLFRAALKIGGTAAGVLAFFNPAWGAAAQAIIGALGAIAAGVGTVWGVVAPAVKAQTGLTGTEATAVLNKASLDKARGSPIIPAK